MLEPAEWRYNAADHLLQRGAANVCVIDASFISLKILLEHLPLRGEDMAPVPAIIRTPDQRIRVFISSTLQEMAPERVAAREAVAHLRLTPVLFELGARPHPPQDLYRAYLAQSQIFVGMYWERYGWVAPNMDISGLEDEYRLSQGKPRLIYIKTTAPNREPRLNDLLKRIQSDGVSSYQKFSTPEELRELMENDLAVLLTERFEQTQIAGPMAAAPARRRTNLEAPTTSFVGREKEIADIHRMLQRDDTRLVTLSGLGGTGKTRLSSQIAAGMLDHFRDGVFFVPLSRATEASQIVRSAAEALEIREAQGEHLADSLLDYMREKHMLLVLDNFEQAVNAAGILVEWVTRCPSLKILVTSRIPLRLRGEKEYPIMPLDVPDPQRAAESEALAALASYSSAQLFIQRAQAVRPAFEATPANAWAIAAICQRLDGLPLALELAAGRIKLFTPSALLRHLQQRLDILSGGARDLPERQQTWRNTMDWSYELLDEKARVLFCRLGVFARGFTLEAAEAVTNARHDLGADILDHVVTLVDNSFLQQYIGASGEPRFGMLQIVREYALQRLQENGEADTLGQEHAAYFLMLAEQGAPALPSPKRQSWLPRLEDDLENFRSSLQRSLSAEGQLETGLRLACALTWFWYHQRRLTEGRRWFEELLKRAGETTSPRLRGAALFGLGFMAAIQYDPTIAQDWLNQALEIHRELGDQRSLAYDVALMGFNFLNLGDEAASQSALSESVTLLRALSDRWGEATMQSLLGEATLLSADADSARAAQEQALVVFRELGDFASTVSPLRALGMLAMWQGDHRTARSLLEQSLGIARQSDERIQIVFILVYLAFSHMRLGELERARIRLKEGLDLSRELHSRSGLALYFAVISELALAQGQPQAAARLLGAADGILAAGNAQMWPSARPILDDTLSTARNQLAPAEFEAAFAEGSALSVEETVGLAASYLHPA